MQFESCPEDREGVNHGDAGVVEWGREQEDEERS